ncbi:MAG TPA: hypothetical protein VFV89_17590 [Nocardioides sp.]|uniref:hypothetical protein n=1 Tax=Nocardioides sp. TaxID=35761 RepID=UPI002E374F64|nr:hypothetical protein [Nocardioides sp.]HEX5089625.1 hypothetical protein [Nocardioides sp.]
MPCGGERRGLPGPGGALDDEELCVPGQRFDDATLGRVEAVLGQRDRLRRSVGAPLEPGGELLLDIEDAPGGEGADVFGNVVAAQQRHAGGDDAVGEVLGQLGPGRGVGDHAEGGDLEFDLTADVGGVPG